MLAKGAPLRLRSAAALTHPVTLAALAALLVNDILFKAAWPDAWVTGKLSDLAWITFAPPLLAFALSPAARGAFGERAVFAAAYIGLPLLYAAFNTFAAVHDPIVEALSWAGGGGGPVSPLDPTDSLVVPLGLGAAVWVWRRSAINIERLRTRLALLAAGVAALATVATTEEPLTKGITGLGAAGDGSIVACGARQQCSTSYNGGFTWKDSRGAGPVQEEQSVATPRGTYSIEGVDITRTVGGERETAYSAAYLWEKSNIRAQWLATAHLTRDEITTGPYAIVYDDSSGNVVVAMGLQGVVVGTPNGEWAQVGVGPYVPTDFSVSGKLRDWDLWILGLAMALTSAAAAIVLSSNVRRVDLLCAFFGPPIAIVPVFLVLVSPWQPFAIGAAWVISSTAWICRWANHRTGGSVFFIGLAGTLTYLGWVETTEMDSAFTIPLRSELAAGLTAVPFAGTALAIHLEARHIPASLVALIGMLALSALSVILWTANAIGLETMFLSAVSLTVVVACLLRRRIRRSEEARGGPEASSPKGVVGTHAVGLRPGPNLVKSLLSR